MASLTLTPGADIATFGADKDFVIGTLANLTSIDAVNFGDGAADDVLILTTAGTVDFRAGGNAAGMTRLERLDLAAGVNSVFLTTALVAGAYVGAASAGFFSVRGNTGDDTIDASLVGGAGNRVQFVLGGGGNDTFTGTTDADVLRVQAAELTAADVLDAGASSNDLMRFDSAGAVDAGAFANVRRVERIELNAGGNAITLTQAFAASADGGVVRVFSGGGANTVDATAATTAVQFFTGAGTDQYAGGTGVDTVVASTATLSGTDVLTGGTGPALDVLQLAGGTYTAAMLAGVTQFERVLLLAPGSEVFLAPGMAATSSATFAVIGTAGNDRVVAAPGDAARVGFNPGSGSDRFTGADGDDQINMTIADLDATDQFDGGAGRDRIGFLSAGTINAAQTAGLASFETFSLSSAGPNTVFLGTNLPNVNVAGGSGNDTVHMALPTQFTSLGAGDDTMVVTAGAVPVLSSYGKEGTDTIRTVGGGTFTFGEGIVEFELLVIQDPGAIIDLTANLQALAVTGTSGVDEVLLGASDTTATMGAGNDRVTNGAGNDTLDGGADFDTFILAPGGGTVDLRITGPQDTGQGIDTIRNFENAQGNTGDDTLTGDDNPNILNGREGDDRIFGLGANDTLFGGAGNDLLDGGTGNDTADYRFAAAGIVVNLGAAAPQTTADGDGGQDTLVGIEYISGSQFDDQITGDGSPNQLWGNGGADTILGGGGDDRIDGGAGDDVLNGEAGTDTVFYSSAAGAVNVSLAITGPQGTGGSGTDTLSGFENLTGSAFDDQLFGDGSANIISGGAGNDYINGGAGADQLLGDAGNDTIEDADGFNLLRGGDGNDVAVLSFAAGNLTGTANSWLQMGNGADQLNLTFNGTTLQPNRGLSTGSNTNGTGAAPDNVEAGDGNDVVNVSGGFTATGSYLLTMSGDDQVNMNTNSVFAFVHLGAGNDQYNGAGGADRVFGGAGDDTLNGNTGDDFFDGGLGNDTMAGGSGTDTVSYAATATSATGGVTVDLALSSVQDTGGAGTDTLFQIENLVGTAFGDTLLGNDQANRLEGGAGDDIIAGRGGADTISTGSGNDQVRYFAASEGGDTLTSFDAGTPNDVFAFLSSAFPLFTGQTFGDVRIDNSAGGNLAAVTGGVVGRSGVANAAAVDAYLAGATQSFAGGVFVLGQAGAGQNISLYYDPNAAASGGANSAVLLATIQGVTSLASFSTADFVFFS